ncbi:MAG: KEOPS complex subunit Cgi121 [Candidatus Bathyarchaeia archaeon]
MNEPIIPKQFVSIVKEAVQPSLVQLFDADSVAGHIHIVFATINSLKAFMQGRRIANSLDVEILLYVSAQRQISKAIEKVGLRVDTARVAAVIIADDDKHLEEAGKRLDSVIPGRRDDSVLDISESKIARLMELYDVNELEMQAVDLALKDALSWLIVERCALLNVRR